MKYKGISENTLKHILQSNETTLLQKAVTEMVGTITNSADSLLSSFSIEKFFSNKNFSDLSDFVKNILDNVKSITEKAYTANVNTASLEKTIGLLVKDIKVNTAKTSESVNKIASKTEKSKGNITDNTDDINDKAKFISDSLLATAKALNEIYSNPVAVFKEVFSDTYILPIKKSITEGLKNTFPLLTKVISNIKNADTDYTVEQRADEERVRSEKQSGLLSKTTDFLLSTLAPWLKDFDESKKLESNGFLSTFFPMLANFINASPLLLKILNWGKLILGIGGSIFGIWKFVEGIGKAVDVLGHEIDFTSLHGWLEALNLGLGNIVSSITGIDLKTVYNWLHNFDRTLANVYKRYLAPIVNGLWKSIKSMFTSAYNNILRPVIDRINNYFDTFAEKFPAISQSLENLYNWLKNDLGGILASSFDTVRNSLSKSFNSLTRAFTDDSDSNEYKEIVEIFKSPIETISLEITEIMKYIGTIYTMFSEMGSWKDLFDKDKWAEAYEKVSESSLYTGNQYSDEIYALKKDRERMTKSFDFIKKLSEGYEKMTIQDMGITQEEIAEKGMLKAIRDRLGNEADKSRFDRIVKEMNIEYGSEKTGQPKEVFEAFRKERLQMFQSDFDSHNKKIDDINKKIEMYENLGRKEKFIGDQIRAGKSKIEAEKIWNKYQDRTMSIQSQAEAEIEKEKAVQANVNAPVITDNSVHTIVEQSSNTSASNNDRDLMTSKVLTAN